MMQTHLMQNQNVYSNIDKRYLKNKEVCSELGHHYHLKKIIVYIVIYLVSLKLDNGVVQYKMHLFVIRFVEKLFWRMFSPQLS